MNLKVATYNVWSGKNNGEKQTRDYNWTARVISQLAPDIIGLQEVSKQPFAEFSVCDIKEEAAEYLGKKTGMYFAFAPSMKINGYEFGNAILSKYPINKTKTVIIPDENINRETRCILVAEVDFCGGITVIVTHFGFAQEEHIQGVKTVLSLVREIKTPIIFMGDLNSTPDNENLKPLFQELNDTEMGKMQPYTWPSARTKYVGVAEEKYKMNKNRRVDYIFTSKHFKTVKSNIYQSRASDHLPFYAQLEFVK